MSDGPSNSKPPRNPAGSNLTKCSPVNVHHRSGTPPRPMSNPGTQVDQNFVTENWDDEDSEHRERHSTSKSSNRKVSKSNYSNVQADDNWLNEDFDS